MLSIARGVLRKNSNTSPLTRSRASATSARFSSSWTSDIVAPTHLRKEQTQTTGRSAMVRYSARARPRSCRFLGIGAAASFFLKAVPDGLELDIDHAGRHVEAVSLGQLVQEGPLHAAARDASIILTDAVLDHLLQRGEIVGAELLGELVVDDGGAGSRISLTSTSNTASLLELGGAAQVSGKVTVTVR